MRQRTVSPLRMMRQRKRRSTKLTQTRTTAATTTVTRTMMCVLQQQQEAKPRALAQLNTTQVVPLNTIPPQLQQQNSRTSAPSLTLYERNKIAVVMRISLFFFLLFLYLNKHISHSHIKQILLLPMWLIQGSLVQAKAIKNDYKSNTIISKNRRTNWFFQSGIVSRGSNRRKQVFIEEWERK